MHCLLLKSVEHVTVDQFESMKDTYDLRHHLKIDLYHETDRDAKAIVMVDISNVYKSIFKSEFHDWY